MVAAETNSLSGAGPAATVAIRLMPSDRVRLAGRPAALPNALRNGSGARVAVTKPRKLPSGLSRRRLATSEGAAV